MDNATGAANDKAHLMAATDSRRSAEKARKLSKKDRGYRNKKGPAGNSHGEAESGKAWCHETTARAAQSTDQQRASCQDEKTPFRNRFMINHRPAHNVELYPGKGERQPDIP